MKYRALITQREEMDNHNQIVEKLEVNYIKFFNELDIELFPISAFQYNLEKIIEELKINLIIFSGGGNGNPKYYLGKYQGYIQKNRDILEEKLFSMAQEYKIPVIGVCRGMQHINGILGGKVRRLGNIREIGKEHLIWLLEERKNILVNNFHNDGILKEDLAIGLEEIGVDEEYNVIEKYCSLGKKILGLQWHPEREYQDKELGKRIILNFLERIN